MSTSAETGSPSRRTIATFDSYPDAERAVEQLAQRDFPVERVTIVGRDLQVVEQVTGRVRWFDALLRGAMAGGFAGLLIGWLFGLFDWFDPVVSAFWLAIDGLWFGMLVGAAIGLLGYFVNRGRRDFGSVSVVSADHYELLVDDGVAEDAQRILAGTSTPNGTTATPQPAGSS
jgi:hypothetical protein